MTKKEGVHNYFFLRILVVIGLAIYYAQGIGYFQVLEVRSEKQTEFYVLLVLGATIWMALANFLVVRRLKGTLNIWYFVLGLILTFALLVISVHGLAGKYNNFGYSPELFITTLSHLFLLSLIPVAAGLILLTNLSISSAKAGDADKAEKAESVPKNEASKNLSLDMGQGKLPFQIPIDNLILVEAADNYCKFSYLKQDALQSELVRIKLKEVEDILAEESHIFRCHRSYLVNGHFVKSITGSSQNYRLELGHGLEQVKVSRLFDLVPIHQLMADR